MGRLFSFHSTCNNDKIVLHQISKSRTVSNWFFLYFRITLLVSKPLSKKKSFNFFSPKLLVVVWTLYIWRTKIVNLCKFWVNLCKNFLLCCSFPLFTISSFKVDILKSRSCTYGCPKALVINWWLSARTTLVVTGVCIFNGYSSLSTESSKDFRSLLNLFWSNFLQFI